MQRVRRSRVALAAAIVVGTLLASPVAAQTPAAVVSGPATVLATAVRSATPRPPAPGPALLISDSAWLSFKLYGTMDAVQGFEHTFALASCRRRVSISCTNYDGYIPDTMYTELDDHPDGFETLIVATGYNDSDANFAQEIETIVALARSHGYKRIVWLTLRSNVSYQSPDDAGYGDVFARSNATLRDVAIARTYPELAFADWATYARDRHDWFSSDGIHLRLAGSYAAADYVSRKMAFLDGRACPQPVSATTEPIDPCPDPDAHGPIIDLASLYPMGQRGPDASFQLSWEGSSSWPAPPWWDR